MNVRSRLPVRRRRLGLTLLAALMATGSASADDPVTAIVGARVFDGSRVLPKATVLIAGGTITAVGADVAAPAGAEVVDGSGRTLLPGLIDAHVHTFGDSLERSLVFGVTTALEMMGDANQAATMRREQAEGRASGRTDLFSAGILATAPGGHGTQFGISIPTLTRPEEAKAFVDARMAEGSDYIKIVYDDFKGYGLTFPTLDRATLEALVTATHAAGKLAVVHVSQQQAARGAIEAGADGLVHVFADSPPEPAFVSLLVSKKAFVIPTLTVVESTTGTPSGASLVEDSSLSPFLKATEVSGLKTSFPRNPSSKQQMDHALAAVRALKAAGVPILAGSDAPNPGTVHGASLHREMELLVRAGLTPTETLASATSVTANAFGLKDCGRIAEGLRADLVLVEGDPTSDILATRRIAEVWKGGVRSTRKPYEGTAAGSPPLDVQGPVSSFDSEKPESAFGAGWDVTTDAIMGGKSTARMQVAAGGAEETAGALEVQGTIAPGLAYAWAGVMFAPGVTPMAPANLSKFKKIAFWARGDGGTYTILVFATRFGMMPQRKSFVAGSEWKRYELAFEAFGTDGNDLMGIAWTAGVGRTDFSFRIDEVRFTE